PVDSSPPSRRTTPRRRSRAPLSVGQVTSTWTGRGVSLRAPICLPSSERGCAPFLSVSHIKSVPPFGLAASWHPGLRFGIFFLIFSVPREVDGPDNFDLAFGFTQLETAGASIVRDASVDRIIHQPRTSECNGSEISHLTATSL